MITSAKDPEYDMHDCETCISRKVVFSPCFESLRDMKRPRHVQSLLICKLQCRRASMKTVPQKGYASICHVVSGELPRPIQHIANRKLHSCLAYEILKRTCPASLPANYVECMLPSEVAAYLGSLETPGIVASVGDPIILQILSSWSASSTPGNKGRPTRSSAKMQPTLHMSISGP